MTLLRIYEDLRGLGYEGGYDAVRRYAAAWRRQGSTGTAAAFVPLSFDPGEAYQFDWSHEIVLIGGVTVTVKGAHMRLCHSRMPFVRAYPRETQEMVFDAHDRAFAFYKGACTRGIYDIEPLLRHWSERQWRPCTPASGWEKGQVENQVGTIRERLFSPRVRVRSMEVLNDWLVDQCVARAKVQAQPEIGGKTIWAVFEEERASLVPYRGPFDGFHAVQASVSKTCLVRFDNNKYSVQASAVGRPVEVRAYADRIELRQDGRVVGKHVRAFGRGGTAYNPWHYVPVLARKPGALRNGAPFRHWVLPAAIERARRKLRAAPDGDRQMVEILGAVLSDGLPAVEAACAEALSEGVHSADPPPLSSDQWRTMAPILNILARRRDPGPPVTIMTPEALRLVCAPVADCTRYDSLRRAI